MENFTEFGQSVVLTDDQCERFRDTYNHASISGKKHVVTVIDLTDNTAQTFSSLNKAVDAYPKAFSGRIIVKYIDTNSILKHRFIFKDGFVENFTEFGQSVDLTEDHINEYRSYKGS
jgi:hypothetical protein